MAGLVIVGASLAGLRAAETARRRGYAGSITLIGAEQHAPYERPPLSKTQLDGAGEKPIPLYRKRDSIEGELGVTLLLGTPATELQASRQVVIAGDREVPYERLIIASGSSGVSLPGTAGIAGVHVLRTVEDAHAIRNGLATAGRVVIVGAGFIGAEVAGQARARGLPVTMVEAQTAPLTRSVGETVGSLCTELHRANGTDVRCGVGVSGIQTTGGRVSAVHLSDGSRLPADLVLVGIGARPATRWLNGSGIALHERDGGIVCDNLLRTSLPDVFAAGDVAHWPNPLFDDRLMRLEHWTNAAEHGAAAAVAAVDAEHARPVSTVPYFWSDWYGHRLQFVGISTEVSEVHVVAQERLLAFYRLDDRLVGVFAIDRQAQIMKFRRLIAERASFDAAMELFGALSAA